MLNISNIPDNLKRTLPGEFQTENPSIPVNINFLQQNRFAFIINRCPTVTYFCQRVNLPSLTLNISDQSAPHGIPIRRPGNRFNFEDLQLSFPVDENMVNYKEIFTWMKSSAPWSDNKELLPENYKTSNASLLIYNNAYKPIITYKFYDCFPTFLSGLDFDITLPDTDVIMASVVFTYTYFDIIEDQTT